jgi:hypothetical protein
VLLVGRVGTQREQLLVVRDRRRPETRLLKAQACVVEGRRDVARGRELAHQRVVALDRLLASTGTEQPVPLIEEDVRAEDVDLGLAALPSHRDDAGLLDAHGSRRGSAAAADDEKEQDCERGVDAHGNHDSPSMSEFRRSLEGRRARRSA